MQFTLVRLHQAKTDLSRVCRVHLAWTISWFTHRVFSQGSEFFNNNFHLTNERFYIGQFYQWLVCTGKGSVCCILCCRFVSSIKMAAQAHTDHACTLSEILVLLEHDKKLCCFKGSSPEQYEFFAQTLRSFPESRGQQLLLNQNNHATVAVKDLICFLENAVFKPGQ